MAISLKSIRRTTNISAPRMLIYGVAGVGKTSLCAGAPNPIFLFTEDGAGALSVNAFPIARSYQDVIDALSVLLTEDHGYQTLVLDSIDHLEPLVWAQTCFDHQHATIEDFGFGKGYLHALHYWQTLMDGLNALRNQKGMAIVLIGHSQIVSFHDPLQDSYDRYQLKLHKRANELISESLDAVLFMNYRTFTQTEDLGFGNKKVRGVATGQRVICTRESPAYYAKNRYSLPTEILIPDYPANPWMALQDAIVAGITAHQAAAAPPVAPEQPAHEPATQAA